MKKRVAFFLLAAIMLLLAACGAKIEPAQTQPQATEAPTQAPAPVYEPVAAGVYRQAWSEEIDGTVVEKYAYVVLNEDHTGNWIVQGVAALTWDENQLTTTVGEVCSIAMTRENDTVKLLVYPDQHSGDAQVPSVYERIEKLPEEIETMIIEDALAQRGELGYPGTYCQTWNEEVGGNVVERKSYLVLNMDHTGTWITQEVGTVTWDKDQMTDQLGVSYRITRAQENGTVKLMVYEFQDMPSMYERIEMLPADIESMISAS